jgi:hypothetical protein
MEDLPFGYRTADKLKCFKNTKNHHNVKHLNLVPTLTAANRLANMTSLS